MCNLLAPRGVFSFSALLRVLRAVWEYAVRVARGGERGEGEGVGAGVVHCAGFVRIAGLLCPSARSDLSWI